LRIFGLPPTPILRLSAGDNGDDPAGL
jgi:hypothetical protein